VDAQVKNKHRLVFARIYTRMNNWRVKLQTLEGVDMISSHLI
jgi:hypothetical protein